MLTYHDYLHDICFNLCLLMLYIMMFCRELDISREAALRRAAEIRLEQLVDMYGDPSVMEELRERLPRAGKGDARTRLQQEIEELAKKETVSLASS